MKKIINSSLLILCAVNALAKNKNAHKVPRPKLVVGIVVDQMRWDYLYRYNERYGKGGFKRLMNKGFNCQNAFLNYVPSYTAPGHATIYSGAVPAVHGIVGNDWIENKTNKSRYCAQDDSVISIGGSQMAGKMSPRQMKSNTVGDELRLASNFRSTVMGVALKDRGAIFSAGHLANSAFWFDDSTGNFITSNYYKNDLPSWIKEFNSKRWPDTILSKNWETLYPIASYVQSIEDSNAYEALMAGESAPVFPHTPNPKNYKSIRSLPAGNTFTFDFAKKLLEQEKLGQSEETDMLTISLSATDYVGHAYAPNAIEVEDLYLRLDQDLSVFLRYLDKNIGEGNYVVFLSADHGGAHNAPFLKDRKMPAGILSEYDMKRQLNAALAQKFGTDSLCRAVMNYQIVLNEKLISEKQLNRNDLKSYLITICKQYEGMADVVDIENLHDALLPDFIKSAIGNGYYAARSGCIGLIYEPAWYSDGPKGTTHGTWNPYDTHIPLLWYGWGIKRGASYEKINVTDIAATLAALLKIQMPNGASGKVIHGSVK